MKQVESVVKNLSKVWFRVYDKKEKTYLNVEDYYYWNHCVWIQKYKSKNEPFCIKEKDKRYIVELCTNETDADGNMIYEGDILVRNSDKKKIKVFYTEFGTLRAGTSIHNLCYIGLLRYGFHLIGNIHNKGESK